MKRLTLCLLAGLLAAPHAFAEVCTPDQANALAAEVGERINEIMANDPQRAAEINDELTEMKLHRTAETLQDECKAYRARLQEIERARKRADLPPADQVYDR